MSRITGCHPGAYACHGSLQGWKLVRGLNCRRRLVAAQPGCGEQTPQNCLTQVDEPIAFSFFSVPHALGRLQMRSRAFQGTRRPVSCPRRRRPGSPASIPIGSVRSSATSPVFQRSTPYAHKTLLGSLFPLLGSAAYCTPVQSSRVPLSTSRQRSPFERTNSLHSKVARPTSAISRPVSLAPFVLWEFPAFRLCPCRLSYVSSPKLGVSQRNAHSWSLENSLSQSHQLLHSAFVMPSQEFTSLICSESPILSSASTSAPRTLLRSVVLDSLLSCVPTKYVPSLARRFLAAKVRVPSHTPQQLPASPALLSFFFPFCACTRLVSWTVQLSFRPFEGFSVCDSRREKVRTVIQGHHDIVEKLRAPLGSLFPIGGTAVNRGGVNRSPQSSGDFPSSTVDLGIVDNKGLRRIFASELSHTLRHHGSDTEDLSGEGTGKEPSMADRSRLKGNPGTEGLGASVGTLSVEGVGKWMRDLWMQLWKGNRWKGPQRNKWKWYHRHGYWATRKKLIDFQKYRRYGYHECRGLGKPRMRFWEDPSHYKRLKQAVRFW